MRRVAAKVCAVVLVIAYFSEQCYSLSINYEHVENNDFKNDEDLLAHETLNYIEELNDVPVTEIPKQPENNLFKLLFGDDLERGEGNIGSNKIDDETKYDESGYAKTAGKSRVTRQAYAGQATLYPNLPSNPPYNQYQPYNSNQNPQWQPTNNYSQHGYPSNGVSFYPSSTQQNATHGYKPSPSQGQNPYYSNNPYSPSLPGYRSPNNTFNTSGHNRPPYNSHGQFNNNTYPGYQTPGYRPGNTTYNPSQRPLYYPTTPSNRHPVIYNPTSIRPSYNNHNSSYPSVRPSYNASNGQNPQYFNSYPNNPYGKPNSTFPHNAPSNQVPYHNPLNGSQYPAYNSNAGGSPYGPNPQNFNSFSQGPNQNPYNNPYNGQNLGWNSYPSAPNLANGYQPPQYGSGPGQYNNIRYPPPGNGGTAHDPTKVSPEYFSYPH